MNFPMPFGYPQGYWDGNQFVMPPYGQQGQPQGGMPAQTQAQPPWVPGAAQFSPTLAAALDVSRQAGGGASPTETNPMAGAPADRTVGYGLPFGLFNGPEQSPAFTNTGAQIAKAAGGLLGHAGIPGASALGTLAAIGFQTFADREADRQRGARLQDQYQNMTDAQLSAAVQKANDPLATGAIAAAGDSPGWGGKGGDAAGATGDFGGSKGGGDFGEGGISASTDGTKDGGGGWFSRGGVVRGGIAPIDPPGPDNRVIGAQSGEGVLTRAAMKRYPGLLEAANAGRLNGKKLRGLLG